jgi:deoxyguanosine kinase
MEEPRYITVEGVIGVGKTSLATKLSERLGARLVLEDAEGNPFLSDFYRDQRGYAFQTQIFFLLARHRQQRELRQQDLFAKKIVSDYCFFKDRIFAYLNLDEHEVRLYDNLHQHLQQDIVHPDLVVYLQAEIDLIIKRIRERGRTFERDIVRVDEIDFINNENDFDDLVAEICRPHYGIRYYAPISKR